MPLKRILPRAFKGRVPEFNGPARRETREEVLKDVLATIRKSTPAEQIRRLAEIKRLEVELQSIAKGKSRNHGKDSTSYRKRRK